jgi:histidinol-phosphate aminotransferase
MSSIETLIEQVIRPDVRAQHAYAVPSAEGMLKLDAMENPYTLPPQLAEALGRHLASVALNRYPVPSYARLKQQICHHLGVPNGYGVMLGNGSDELISLLIAACAKPGQAEHAVCVLAPVPTFVMYKISTELAGGRFVGVDLKPDLSLNLDAMLAGIEQHQPSLVFLSYPNNPTGNLFGVNEVERILRAAPGLVVVDEAYQPFAGTSFMPRLPEFNNLVIMRTVSKLGLAGIRLGYMSAHSALLAQVDKVRPPYNINVLTEAAAEFLLGHIAVLDEQAAQIRAARSSLRLELQRMGLEVFPSSANFLLVRMANAEQVFLKLVDSRILVKNVGKMHALLADCLRITVGSPEQNRALLQALQRAL